MVWNCQAKFLLYFYVLAFIIGLCHGYLSRCESAKNYLTAYSYTKTYTPYQYSYPSNDYCYWLITASTGKVIRLKITDFQLESSTNCYDDYLSIYDGTSTSSPIIGKYCGSTRPPMIVSKGRNLYLKFRSDSVLSYRGFTISYVAVSPATTAGKCTYHNSFALNNDIRLTSSSGYIYSPEYPSNYPDYMQCTWKISVPSGHKIKLYFEYMNVASSAFCYSDYLTIRDGYSSSSTKKGDYCGTTRRTIYSSGRYMWIRFRSNYLYNTKGFKLRYTSESSSSGSTGIIIGVIIGIAVIIAVIVIIVYCTKKSRRGVVMGTAAPSAITTTTVTTTAPTQGVPLQPTNNAPPPYENPYPQKGQPYPSGYGGPPPQGYTGPPPQGYTGLPPQGYTGLPPQGQVGPPPQGYPGPPPQGYPGPPPQGHTGPPPMVQPAGSYPGQPLVGNQDPAYPPPSGPPGQGAGPPNVSV